MKKDSNVLKFKESDESLRKKLLILEEKERNVRLPNLKEWFILRNKIRSIKRSLK